MGSAENVALMKRWFDDLWTLGREETIDELFHHDVIGHLENEDVRGTQGIKRVRRAFLMAIPDFEMTLDRLVAEGDQVVGMWHARGTHGGELMGVPPTHEQVEFRGVTWATILDERVVELWINWNLAHVLQKLLQQALSEVDVLRRIIPICCHCKKIRNDENYWEQVETYIRNRSPVEFSHGICPPCMSEHYPDSDDP